MVYHAPRRLVTWSIALLILLLTCSTLLLMASEAAIYMQWDVVSDEEAASVYGGQTCATWTATTWCNADPSGAFCGLVSGFKVMNSTKDVLANSIDCNNMPSCGFYFKKTIWGCS
jgi:ABC-type uncharacterized transport system permease subunit